MKGAPLALIAAFAGTQAAAHDLRVFASVDGETVNVEAKFSTGRLPVAGEVRVFDADETLIETYRVDPDGVTSFPLVDGAAETGLMIEVEVGDEGHSDYWLLTPDDIARGQGGS